MAGGADRIAHVVQAVEHRHQVVARRRRTPARARRRKLTRSATPASCGPLARGLDRPVVVVRADERRVRERLRHQDRRGAVAAADVGDAARRARACRRRRRARAATRRPGGRCSPGGRTARSPRGRRGRARASRSPSPLRALSVILGESITEPDRDLEEPRQVRGAARVGERDRLLGRQRVAAAVGVVVDVAARRLGVQPLAHVALGGAGALGQLGRRQPAGAGQRPIPAELVAHHHQRRVQRRSDLVHGAEDELHQLVAVDLDGLLDRAHRSLLGRFRARLGPGRLARFRGPPSLRRSRRVASGAGSARCCSVVSSERQQIERALASARSGASATLALVGEAGIGKTALLDHAAERAAGMRVLRARGIESEAQIPFASLLELLRPALVMLEQIPEPQAVALEGALALRRGPAQERFAVGAATLSLLAAYAEEAPVAMLVDDAHWLDGSSAQALLFAFRRLVADPIAVLIAVREGDPSLLDGADLPDLRLGGLTSDEAATAPRRACACRGRAPARRHRRQPARADRARPTPSRRPRARARGRPGAGLRADLARVPAACRRSSTTPPVARSCSRRPATAAICRCSSARRHRARRRPRRARARRERRAREPPCRARSSSAIRWPGRRSTPRASPDQRRDAHRALAAALPDRDVDRRAWHLAAAAVGTDEAASAALEQAGVRSRDRSSYATAAAAFERAARLAADGERRARLLLEGGRGRLARRARRTCRRAARRGPGDRPLTPRRASPSISSPATSRCAEVR